MNVNVSLLSTWLVNLATVVGGGFAVFGDPSLGGTAKAVVAGLTPVLVSILTYATHQLEVAKVNSVAPSTPTTSSTPAA